MSNIVIDIAAEFTGEKALKKADTGMNKLSKSAKKLSGALASAFSVRAITNYAKTAALAAAQDQKAQKLLAINLKNLGLAYANVDSENFIANLEKQTTILDDELRPAYAQLARTTGSISVTQKLMSVAFDASSGAGLGYAQTIDILSQAYVGNKKGLKQLNLGLTTAQIAAMSFDEILTVITDKFKGAGSESLLGYAGDMAKLDLASKNASETIGGALLSSFTRLAGNGSIDRATSKITTFSKILAAIIDPNKVFEGVNFGGFLGLVPTDKPKMTGQQSPGERAAIDKANAKAKKAAEVLLALARARAAAEAALLKTKRDNIALDKASLALAAGQDLFNQDAIQVQAALLNKQAELNKLGLSATDAQRLGIANDVIRLTIKQDIMALEKAIAADDAAAATAAAKKLNADMAILGTLQKQEFKMIDIQKILDSLKTKDLINLANLNAAIASLITINALLASISAGSTSSGGGTFTYGSKGSPGDFIAPISMADGLAASTDALLEYAEAATARANAIADLNDYEMLLNSLDNPVVTGNYAGGSTFLANKLAGMDSTGSYSTSTSSPIIIQITSDAAKLVDVIQAATQENVRFGNNLSYAGSI